MLLYRYTSCTAPLVTPGEIWRLRIIRFTALATVTVRERSSDSRFLVWIGDFRSGAQRHVAAERGAEAVTEEPRVPLMLIFERLHRHQTTVVCCAGK